MFFYDWTAFFTHNPCDVFLVVFYSVINESKAVESVQNIELLNVVRQTKQSVKGGSVAGSIMELQHDDDDENLEDVDEQEAELGAVMDAEEGSRRLQRTTLLANQQPQSFASTQLLVPGTESFISSGKP